MRPCYEDQQICYGKKHTTKLNIVKYGVKKIENFCYVKAGNTNINQCILEFLILFIHSEILNF
jgi:hypothetical protein